MIDISKAQLENAPRYSAEPPTYDAEYGRRVDSYYGPAGRTLHLTDIRAGHR